MGPRRQGQQLNEAIDEALRDPSPTQIDAVVAAGRGLSRATVAEKVRQRASLLGRREPALAGSVLARREAVIFAVYAAAVPTGWYCGWCDGSSLRRQGTRRAGIGGILLDPLRRPVAEFADPIGDFAPLEAEIAALVRLLRIALALGVQRLKVHTDSFAVAHLWLRQRRDTRMLAIVKLAARLRAFRLQRIPRQHNLSAHRMARRGALRQPAIDSSAMPGAPSL